MRVGLCSVDGKREWSNIALMKLSSWHKSKGDIVEWFWPLLRWQYDIIYASKIYTNTPDIYFPAIVVKGGSGYDLKKKLSTEINNCFPDYSIYPENDYAIGFTTRGCNRKCLFCIVSEKEGKLQEVSLPKDFWSGQSKIILLDNNLTAASMQHFFRVCSQLKEMQVQVDFSQGLDLRLLQKEHLENLKDVRLWKRFHFAWDNIRDEQKIRQGINLFKKYYHPDKATVYVLIGFNTTPEEDIYRVEILRNLKVNPFVMPFDKKNSYQKSFARYVNRKAIFKETTWEEYRKPKTFSP